MANNGDKAAALGWTVFPGTSDRRLGYDDINYAMDRTAEQATGKIDKTTILIQQADPGSVPDGTVWISWS
jgi:hypothetical protein